MQNTYKIPIFYLVYYMRNDICYTTSVYRFEEKMEENAIIVNVQVAFSEAIIRNSHEKS